MTEKSETTNIRRMRLSVSIIRRLWKAFKKEAMAIIAIATVATAFISYLDYTGNQDAQEYITQLRKGQQKINLGNGDFIGGKLLIEKSEDSESLRWYWKKNTEPHLIARDNADWITVFGSTTGPSF